MRLFGGDRQRDRFERDLREVFPSLNGTALRLTRNPDAAADLVQETVVRAFEAYDRFDGQNFKAWSLRILTNLYINHYRRRQRTGPLSSLEEDSVDEPVGPPTDIPDQEILANMLEDEVETALANVPDIFRAAVILSDIEGMTYDEIAENLDIPVGTVRSRIARGRAHLRQALERFAIERGYIKVERNDE